MLNKEELKSGFRWIETPNIVGKKLFTFDGNKVYSLFKDYPDELSVEEKEVFDLLNPYWADFFSDRPYNKELHNTTEG